MLTKRQFHKELDKAYHRDRMGAAVIKILIATTPDILELDDDPVFSERNPPYDQEKDLSTHPTG